MNDPLVYLINLDESTDRLARADAQLKNASLPYQRISATDARLRSPGDFTEYDSKTARFWYGRPLKGGELGCYFSHLNCLEKFLATDAQCVLIVEDDLQLDPEFQTVLAKSIGYLCGPDAPNWDAMNFGTPVRQKYFTPIHEIDLKARNVSLCRAHLFPLNTHCILWSRQGAKAFLDNFKSIWQPVDHAMRYNIVRRRAGLCLSEAMAFQSDAPSDIDQVGNLSASRDHGESLWYRFHVWRIKRVERIYAKYMRYKFKRQPDQPRK